MGHGPGSVLAVFGLLPDPARLQGELAKSPGFGPARGGPMTDFGVFPVSIWLKCDPEGYFKARQVFLNRRFQLPDPL